MLSSANVFKSNHVVQSTNTIEIPDAALLTEIDEEENAVEIIKVNDSENEGVVYTNFFSDDETSDEITTDKSENVSTEYANVMQNIVNDRDIVQQVKRQLNKHEEVPQPTNETPAQLTREELLELYKDEIKQVEKTASEQAYAKAYEEAYKQAYNDAFNKRKGELVQVVHKVERCLGELEQANVEYIERYSEELKFLAVEIAEKLILNKIEYDDLILQKLVNKTMETVKNSAWLDVEICERLTGLVEAIRKEIETSNTHSKVTISPKAGKIDMCRVNTDKGTVVSDISRQAEKLRSLFKATN